MNSLKKQSGFALPLIILIVAAVIAVGGAGYYFFLPGGEGDNYKIRVVDASNSQIDDTSDDFFSIISSPSPSEP